MKKKTTKKKEEEKSSMMFNEDLVTEEERKLYKDLTMINALPANRKVILKPLEIEVKTEGGIIIPEANDKERFIAAVVAIAPDARFLTSSDGKSIPGLSIKPGDAVIYSKYNETEINIMGEVFLLVADIDIFVKITSDVMLKQMTATGDLQKWLRPYFAKKKEGQYTYDKSI